MDEIVTDPTGLEFVRTDECWQHIVSRHPEMSPFKGLVLDAIQKPDGVNRGKRDVSRRIYRKRHLQIIGLGGPLDLLVFSSPVELTDMLQQPISQRTHFACWVI